MDTRPSSRRSEDSGLASVSVISSRGSSPVDLKLEFSSMTSSTSSLTSSSISPTTETPSSRSQQMKNYKQSSGLQRSKSQRVGPTDLRKRPLKIRRNATLEAKYENMKFVKMEVKRSCYGRQGWIAKPVDESLDLKQLQMNGAFEQLINDLKVLELSGKEVPNFITVKLK